jgi:hypothetical protein
VEASPCPKARKAPVWLGETAGETPFRGGRPSTLPEREFAGFDINRKVGSFDLQEQV